MAMSTLAKNIARIRRELTRRKLRGVTVTASPSGETCGPITMRFPDDTEEMNYAECFIDSLAQCTDLDSLRRAIAKYDLNGDKAAGTANE